MATLAGGCSDEPPPTPPPAEPDPVRSSPERVLSMMTTAWRNQDLDRYAELLDKEFMFVPSSQDPKGGETLTRDDEVAMAGELFPQALGIHITLHFASVEDPTVAPYSDDPYTYREIFVSSCFVDVLTREVDEGELTTLRVNGDPSRFVFKRSESEPPTYTLVYHADLYSGQRQAPNVEAVSWAQLKTLYRP